jgi:hypothetical protein
MTGCPILATLPFSDNHQGLVGDFGNSAIFAQPPSAKAWCSEFLSSDEISEPPCRTDATGVPVQTVDDWLSDFGQLSIFGTPPSETAPQRGAVKDPTISESNRHPADRKSCAPVSQAGTQAPGRSAKWRTCRQ